VRRGCKDVSGAQDTMPDAPAIFIQCAAGRCIGALDASGTRASAGEGPSGSAASTLRSGRGVPRRRTAQPRGSDRRSWRGAGSVGVPRWGRPGGPPPKKEKKGQKRTRAGVTGCGVAAGGGGFKCTDGYSGVQCSECAKGQFYWKGESRLRRVPLAPSPACAESRLRRPRLSYLWSRRRRGGRLAVGLQGRATRGATRSSPQVEGAAAAAAATAIAAAAGRPASTAHHSRRGAGSDATWADAVQCRKVEASV
jgi:hypothetical protein